jgi:hypothetical protein
MNEWLGGTGETEFLDGINYCDDRAYYGVFKT